MSRVNCSLKSQRIEQPYNYEQEYQELSSSTKNRMEPRYLRVLCNIIINANC